MKFEFLKDQNFFKKLNPKKELFVVLFFALSLSLFLSCNSAQKPKAQESEKGESDSTLLWLNTVEKPLDEKEYMPFLINYIKKAEGKKYDQAAQALHKTLGNTLVFGNTPPQLISLIKEFVETNESKIQPHSYALLYLDLGLNHTFKMEYDSSNYYLNIAVAKNIDTNSEANNITLFNIHHYLAYNLMAIGQMDKALIETTKSLAFKCPSQPTQHAMAYTNLVNIFVYNKEYETALKYNELALESYKKHKEYYGMFSRLIAKIELLLFSDKEAAKKTALETIQTYKELKIDNPVIDVMIHLRTAIVYSRVNQWNECDSLLNYIKPKLALINDKPSEAEFLILSARRDVHQNKPILNQKKMMEVLSEHIEQKSYPAIIELSNALKEDAVKRKDYQDALKFVDIRNAAEDSLVNENTAYKVKTFEKALNSEKKEKTIQEQKAKLASSKSKIIGLISGISLLALGSGLFFISKRRKQAIREQQLQQKFTDELLQNTEDERKRIATDLHDGVNHELLTLKNQISTGKSIAVDDLEKVINEVRQVSRDLYPAMFDNIGLVASIENLCERITEAGLFTTCEINYTLKLSKRNELQLYRIIQEALNNTLKHAKANAAKVTIETMGNELQVEIKDNGIGFDANEKMKNASSFGIQSLKQRARAMGGKSTIESDTNGTKLILKTPIH